MLIIYVFCLFPISLPKFIVVPQKVLDTELKKSFAHFNEGRIPVSFSGHVLIFYLLQMGFKNRYIDVIFFFCLERYILSTFMAIKGA